MTDFLANVKRMIGGKPRYNHNQANSFEQEKQDRNNSNSPHLKEEEKIGSLAVKVRQIYKIPSKFLRSENYHKKLQFSLKTTILFVFHVIPFIFHLI
jgi:hypothetical protein